MYLIIFLRLKTSVFVVQITNDNAYTPLRPSFGYKYSSVPTRPVRHLFVTLVNNIIVKFKVQFNSRIIFRTNAWCRPFKINGVSLSHRVIYRACNVLSFVSHSLANLIKMLLVASISICYVLSNYVTFDILWKAIDLEKTSYCQHITYEFGLRTILLLAICKYTQITKNIF